MSETAAHRARELEAEHRSKYDPTLVQTAWSDSHTDTALYPGCRWCTRGECPADARNPTPMTHETLAILMCGDYCVETHTLRS